MMRHFPRWGSRRTVSGMIAVLTLFGAAVWVLSMRMPGQSYRDTPPPLEGEEELEERLLADVKRLVAFGPRHVGAPTQLHGAGRWLEDELSSAGYEVEQQRFLVDGVACDNLSGAISGSSKPDEIVVVGAHYDTEPQTPGADDNASGVAALLALARQFAQAPRPARTLRFVAFVNEEMPHFYTGNMGSFQAARESKQRGENVVAMLSLESIGYFSTTPGSQQYPPGLSWFYPTTGDFIAFVGNLASRALLRETMSAFRSRARVASEGAALPEMLPGVSWSDHWAYWKHGYPALMVTDTAPFRNPHYHRPSDTPDTLDTLRMTHVVLGLQAVIERLTTP